MFTGRLVGSSVRSGEPDTRYGNDDVRDEPGSEVAVGYRVRIASDLVERDEGDSSITMTTAATR